MRKLILLSLLAFTFAQAGFAQKLIIGSKTPDLKGVEWKTSAPQTGKATLIEFYQSTNESSSKLYLKLAKIASKYGGAIDIVVLTREDNATINSLVQQDGSRYSFGYDADGTVYDAYGVKFVPFTMLVDSKGNLLWQGNLSNITDQVLQKVK